VYEPVAYRLLRRHGLQDADEPRKASGRTELQNWAEAIETVAAFIRCHAS
jgi:hypothetical protein